MLWIIKRRHSKTNAYLRIYNDIYYTDDDWGDQAILYRRGDPLFAIKISRVKRDKKYKPENILFILVREAGKLGILNHAEARQCKGYLKHQGLTNKSLSKVWQVVPHL